MYKNFSHDSYCLRLSLFWKKENLSEGSSDTFAFLMLLIEQKGIIWMRVSIFILIYAKLWDIFQFIANITGRKQYKYFFIRYQLFRYLAPYGFCHYFFFLFNFSGRATMLSCHLLFVKLASIQYRRLFHRGWLAVMPSLRLRLW